LAVVRLNGPQMPMKLSEGLPSQYLGVLMSHTKCLLFLVPQGWFCGISRTVNIGVLAQVCGGLCHII